MSDLERLARPSVARAPKPEPIRRRGEPFFDGLVGHMYSPVLVRRTLYGMLKEQYDEAQRVHRLRGWGGAQPVGNDRYQYSLEQERRLTSALPGAEMLRPSQSLLYGIADALVYPMHFGNTADDCPTSAQIGEESQIQSLLAAGLFHDAPTLFDPDPTTPRTVVWLLFAGNAVEGGPLAAYLARPGGLLPKRRIDWTAIEPLLVDTDDTPPAGPDDRPRAGVAFEQVLPPEPNLGLHLRR